MEDNLHQLTSIFFYPKIIENYRKLDKINYSSHGFHGYYTDGFATKIVKKMTPKIIQNYLETKIRLLKEGYKNYKKSIDIFRFAYKNAAHCIGKQTKIMFFYDQQLKSIFSIQKL